MRKIFISAGHTKGGVDRGASGNGYFEGDLTVELRDLICAELKKEYGVTAIVDDNKNALQQTINTFKAYVNPDAILLDIHFNAAIPQAKGVECFIPNQYTNFEVWLAHELSAVVSEVLNTPLRKGSLKYHEGVKTESESARQSLGWMRLTGENVLLEVCFISNTEEMVKYQNKKHILAKQLAKVLYLNATKRM